MKLAKFTFLCHRRASECCVGMAELTLLTRSTRSRNGAATFGFGRPDPVRSAATAQRVAPLENTMDEYGVAHSLGRARCTYWKPEITMRVPANSMLVSASTRVEFLFASAQTSRSGGLYVERNCLWSAEIESSALAIVASACSSNRCCGFFPAINSERRGAERRCPR